MFAIIFILGNLFFPGSLKKYHESQNLKPQKLRATRRILLLKMVSIEINK